MNITDGETISTTSQLVRLTPTQSVSGIVLEPGKKHLQQFAIINESMRHSLTFADPAISHVADAKQVLRLSALQLAWDDDDQRWYHEFFVRRERES